MRVVVLANYQADRQPSMLRFVHLLHDELAARGVDTDLWQPPAVVGGRTEMDGGLHTWLGYADKYALYPPRLRRAVRRCDPRETVVHVCDHSNAVYVPSIAAVPHVVTCHDLIAVRAAFDEFPAERTRWSGRRLQERILAGLRAADRIVCDSESTRADVQRLVRPGDHRVMAPGLGAAFTPVAPDEARTRLAPLGVKVSRPYLLHVGGTQWYKNRAGVLDIYTALVDRMPDAPPLVMVGRPLSNALARRVQLSDLSNRVVVLSSVSDAQLAALYSSAALLLFPSLVEGFGWPVLEAMACGCRVVASNRAPMTEVGGDVATYVDPQRAPEAAIAIARVLLESGTQRHARATAGLARAAKFTTRAMVDGYLDVYREALDRHRSAA